MGLHFAKRGEARRGDSDVTLVRDCRLLLMPHFRSARPRFVQTLDELFTQGSNRFSSSDSS